MLQNERMDPIIRKYTSLEEMKADEYRYWQGRPVHERMDAVEEINLTAYALKSEPHATPHYAPSGSIPRRA